MIKRRSCILLFMFILILPTLLFSADVYYENGMVIRDCEIINEDKSSVTIKSYTESGTQELYILKRLIKHIDPIERDETQYTTFGKDKIKTYSVDGENKIIEKEKKYSIESDIKINAPQFASGVALIAIGTVFAYDLFAPETGFNKVIDNLSGDLKKEYTIKRNLRYGACGFSIVAGIININESIEKFEINITANSVGISYKF
ncbi:hypothetical protein J7L48_09440 [bacterium]|nr:hypothetical protein [bacterium]